MIFEWTQTRSLRSQQGGSCLLARSHEMKSGAKAELVNLSFALPTYRRPSKAPGGLNCANAAHETVFVQIMRCDLMEKLSFILETRTAANDNEGATSATGRMIVLHYVVRLVSITSVCIVLHDCSMPSYEILMRLSAIQLCPSV